VVGMRQYRRMESSCAGAPLAREPGNVEAAGKAEKRETNASDLRHLRQPRGRKLTHPAKGRRLRTWGHGKPTCRRSRLPPQGEPQTSVVRPRQQEVAIAAKHQATWESFSPSQEGAVARDILQPVCQDSGADEKMEEDGDRSDTAETVPAETPPTGPATGDGTTWRTNCI
jgi:hypothetical protein